MRPVPRRRSNCLNREKETNLVGVLSFCYGGSGGFSSNTRIWGKASMNRSMPALSYSLSGDQFMQTNATVQARISPQWINELK